MHRIKQVERNRKPISAISLAMVFIAMMIVYYTKPLSNVIAWDVFGYYLYLPATFIYGDLKMTDIQWLNDIISIYRNTDPLCQISPTDDGTHVMVYSIGLAVLNGPLFLLALLITPLTAYPADGFSKPYQLALSISSNLYTLAGLIFIRKVLLRYFNDLIAAMVIILLVAGTNFLHHGTYASTMPHNYLFALLAIMIWALIRWEDTHRLLFMILIGLSGGLITLTRPNEIVVFLIPLLWGVYGIKSARQRLSLLYRYRLQLLWLVLTVFLVLFSQMLYWKLAAGEWVHYSYPDGVMFDFSSPFLASVLFSFRKGWLIYTPLMALAIAGLFFVWKKNKGLLLPMVLYLFVNLYIVASWSCWWYAGGDFSQRALVSSYAVLTIPLGYFLTEVLQTRLKYIVLPILIFLMSLNLFQTWQFHQGIIDGERMTRAYYISAFGKTDAAETDRDLLLVDRKTLSHLQEFDARQFQKKVVCHLDFETMEEGSRDQISAAQYRSGTHALRMDSAYHFSPGLAAAYCAVTLCDYAYIRASVWVYIPEDYSDTTPLLACNILHKNTSYFYADAGISSDSLNPGWKMITLIFMTPEIISPYDHLYLNVWTRGDQPVWVDDLRVEVFEACASPSGMQE